MTTPQESDARRWAAAADLVAVLVFVLIGRASHGESGAVTGILRTVWPFAVGLAAGWLAVLRLGWPGTALHSGLVVAAATGWLGLLVRGVAGQGVAISFAVVASVFLALFVVGWRLVFGSSRILRN